jgi:hypothetical protein
MTLVLAVSFFAAPQLLRAELLEFLPGPDDQGGMIMPMVMITDTDNLQNPTFGTLRVNFNPSTVPQLADLQHWSPGSWLPADAAWRPDLGSPTGVGGTPAANAGRGDLFNNQYGFTFMANPNMGRAFVPVGKSLGIRLVSLSSPLLRSFHYDDWDNLWDEVLGPVIRPQVLWNGGMWHNYYTLPASAPPGQYTATYEIFIANRAFSGDQRVDYSPGAVLATADPNFTPVRITYTWTVYGEPPAPASPPVASLHFEHGTPVITVTPTRPDRRYQWQAAAHPGGPWQNLGTQRPGQGGALATADPQDPMPPQRFYRVVELP